MFRFASIFLEKWYKKENRKPLLLRGARQVGKSTLVELFCKDRELDLITINLEEEKVVEFSKENRFSLESCLLEMEAIAGKKISAHSLLFIDEIQEQPLALQRLRFFKEKRPDLAVISAGSLLEKVISSEKYRAPVGRIENYYLGPMTFREFLIAADRIVLLDSINNFPEKIIPISVHEKLMEQLKIYYYVGGMPEAVKTYISEKSYLGVKAIHRDLIKTYFEDIPKYSHGKKAELITGAFEYSAINFGKKAIFSKISNSNSRDIRAAFDILRRIHVIHQCFHSNATGIPLSAISDKSVFKPYFLDIGLTNYVMKVDVLDIIQKEHTELLNIGSMAEQFIAQHLAYIDGGVEESNLYYWLQDKKKQKGEVDFLLAHKSNIYPIEVKSGISTKTKSLWNLVEKSKSNNVVLFNATMSKNFIKTVSGKDILVIQLPLYCVELLTDIIDQFV